MWTVTKIAVLIVLAASLALPGYAQEAVSEL
jgi:hypothetical protein